MEEDLLQEYLEKKTIFSPSYYKKQSLWNKLKSSFRLRKKLNPRKVEFVASGKKDDFDETFKHSFMTENATFLYYHNYSKFNKLVEKMKERQYDLKISKIPEIAQRLYRDADLTMFAAKEHGEEISNGNYKYPQYFEIEIPELDFFGFTKSYRPSIQEYPIPSIDTDTLKSDMSKFSKYFEPTINNLVDAYEDFKKIAYV